MFKILSVRFASVVGILSLALFTAGLVSIPSFPTIGAGLLTTHSATSVNRALKGDRLPVLGTAAGRREFESLAPASPSPAGVQSTTRIPAGCDRAFSPISSPQLANVFKRCIT